MTELVDKLGRKRSPATLPGFRKGQPNGNKGKRFRAETLTPEQILLLISGQSRTSATGLRHRAWIATSWRSGMRIAESLDLQIADLNFGAATIHIRRGKGDKDRRVIMDPFGWEFLTPWLACRAELPGVDPHSGYVFCVADGPTRGGQLGSPTIRTMLKHTARMSGITDRVAPHLLRHSHACELFEAGIDLRVISAQLGHADLAITAHYLNHLSPKAQHDAISSRPSPLVEMEAPRPALSDVADAVRAAAGLVAT